MAQAMAKAHGGDAEHYLLTFLRFIVDPGRVTALFLEHFYQTFQPDLDEIGCNGSGLPTISASAPTMDLHGFIEFQKENVEDLQQYIDKMMRLYHETLLGYRKMTHNYHVLLAAF